MYKHQLLHILSYQEHLSDTVRCYEMSGIQKNLFKHPNAFVVGIHVAPRLNCLACGHKPEC